MGGLREQQLSLHSHVLLLSKFPLSHTDTHVSFSVSQRNHSKNWIVKIPELFFLSVNAPSVYMTGLPNHRPGSYLELLEEMGAGREAVGDPGEDALRGASPGSAGGVVAAVPGLCAHGSSRCWRPLVAPGCCCLGWDCCTPTCVPGGKNPPGSLVQLASCSQTYCLEMLGTLPAYVSSVFSFPAKA